MKITCPACSASYNIDSSRVPANGMTMRCPKCSHSFRVESDGATSDEGPVGSSTMLDSAGHASEGEKYYVKRQTGKVFGPFDVGAVQMMLRTNKLASDSEVSLDKEAWTPVAQMSEFAEHISEIPAGSGSDPRVTMMGGWTQREPGRGLDLPDFSGSELPAPKIGVDLPALKGPDLPALKGGVDLPALKGGVDLPALKGGVDLPALKGGFDLPAPKVGSDLPALKSGLDLPAPKGLELPAPKGSNLPAAKAPPLPVSKPPLPAPKAASSDDDLFGASPQKDDDLFGAPDRDDDDLFGTPARGNDLFGDAPPPKAVSDDDNLFGAPVVAQSPSIDDDDLFGGPAVRDEDIFESNATPVKKDEDDFLGGDAGFSFLDDAPAEEDDIFGGGDLFGDEPPAKLSPGVDVPSEKAAPKTAVDSWGDELLDRPKTQANKKVDLNAGADDPFRPKSTGLKEEAAPQPEAAHVGKERATDEDRKRGPMFLGGIALVVLLVGAVGYGVYTMMPSEVVETPTNVPRVVGDVTLDLKQADSDNYGDYAKLIESASAGNVQGDDSARLLIIQSLVLARYPNDALREDAEKRSQSFKDADGGYGALARGAFEASQGNAEAARAYLEPLLSGDGELLFYANAFMGIGDVMTMEREFAEGNVTSTRDKASPPQEADAGEETDAENPEVAEGDAPEVAEGDAPEVAEGDAPEVAEGDAPEVELPAAEQKSHPLSARARIALTSASDLRTDSAIGPYWMGRMEKLNQNPEAAIREWNKALKASETHVASHIELGRAHEVRGELVQALPHAEKVNGELAEHAHATERAEALHIAGMVYKGQRQSDLAIEAFTKALTVDPSRPVTLRALASEYEATKKYKEALNFFTTNKNLGQKEPEVMLGIVRAHTGLEQWSAAIDQLEEGQKTFPQDARFPFYLGRLNLDRGDFLQAQKAYERAAEIDNKLLLAHTALAKLSWRVDQDILKGEEHIGKVVEQSNLIDAEVAADVAEYYYQSERRTTAEDWYREALKRDPNFWEARLALSKLLLEERKFKEAKNLLEKARSEGVQDVRLSAYLADAYRQEGNFDRAIDGINKVIERFPKNEEYIYIRGRIHFDRANYDTALKDFSRAYDINPRFHDAYFYVGRTSFEEGDIATALKIFRHVLDYQPNRGVYRYFMGRALQLEGRDSQALDEYRKATAVDPAYGLENPAIYIHRGRLLSRLGYAADGRRDIAKAIEIAPDMVEALLAMADSNYSEKAYDASIGHYTKALEKEPDHAEGQFRLGMSLIYTGKQREGAQRLQLAIKYGYKNPEVYRTLGYLYKDLGQRKLALESFQTFMQETKEQEIPLGVRREMLRQIQELGG